MTAVMTQVPVPTATKTCPTNLVSRFYHLQPIPALFKGHDRDAGVGFEQFADVGYLDVEGEGVGITIVSPDVFQQIRTFYGLTDMLS